MATLAALRKQAKALKIPASVIGSAEDADELQSIIDDHTDATNGKSSKKSKTAKKGAAKKTAAEPKRGRGRPKGSKNKTTAAKTNSGSKSKSAATKSSKGKASRSTTATAKSAYVPKGGRNLLGDIDYHQTDGWNPREGSVPDRILWALRKAKGNRDKVFDQLVGDVWSYVGKKLQNGSKRPLKDGPGNAHDYLRYRIARTDWDFAKATGQHDVAENRVEYGTGGNGNSKKAKAKPATKTTTGKKRGRPAKAEAETPKRRGRPPGSKNKTKPDPRKAGRKAAKK